jgi:hypothetical protein
MVNHLFNPARQRSEDGAICGRPSAARLCGTFPCGTRSLPEPSAAGCPAWCRTGADWKVLMPTSGAHSRASGYRVPDRRYRRGYRLTSEGIRARRRRRVAISLWVLLLIVAAVAHSAFFAVLVTLAAVGYGIHRYRVSHRTLPPGEVPLRLPSDAPVGERRTRQVIPQAVKVAVAVRDQGRCQCRAGTGCHGYPETCGSVTEPHYDHVIPWSRGGLDTVANLQILCGPCNRRKGADDIAVG